MSRDFRQRLLTICNENGGFRMFDAVTAGGVKLSVQASRFHYCEPRETLTVDGYTRWEVAVIGDNGLTDPRSLPWFPRHIAEMWEHGECPVGPYLPTETVQAIFDAAEVFK